jgi:hypothetical protein
VAFDLAKEAKRRWAPMMQEGYAYLRLHGRLVWMSSSRFRFYLNQDVFALCMLEWKLMNGSSAKDKTAFRDLTLLFRVTLMQTAYPTSLEPSNTKPITTRRCNHPCQNLFDISSFIALFFLRQEAWGRNPSTDMKKNGSSSFQDQQAVGFIGE